MSKSANLKVNVTADASQAQSAMAKLSREMDGLTKIPGTGAAAGVLVWVSAAGAAAKAVKALYNQAKEYVDLYAVQQQAEVKLQATLKATGNEIGVTVTEMYALASSLQSVTTTGDETILGMQQIFIAGKAISKEMLPEVIELSLDMAEAMGTDATSAAQTMAKALADPAKGLEQLKRQNVFFTDSEKAKITELQASNKLAEAQQVILDKIAAAYGGIAREVANTDTGKIQQIKNVTGDIKEGLGEAIILGISPAFDFILEQLSNIQTWIDKLNAASATKKEKKTDNQNYWNKELKGFSGEQLQAKAVELQEVLATPGAQRGTRVWDPYFDQFDAVVEELTARAQAGKDKLQGSASAASAALSPVQEGELTLYQQILAIASATEEAQRRKLTASIAQNEVLRDHLSLQVSAKKMTEEEAKVAKLLLDQQIALDRAALGKLGAKAEDPKTEPAKVQTAGDFIGANMALSKDAQVLAISNNIRLAETFLSAADAGGRQYKQIQEIIDGLKEQRTELLKVEDAVEEVQDRTFEFAMATTQASADLLGSITSLHTRLWQNDIDKLQATLNKQKEIWRKHYADLKDQYKSDRDSLDAKYQWGRISSEEYFSSLTELNDNKRKEEEKAAQGEEALAKKMDDIKRKQFNAEKINSIAQATISGAVGIANIWKIWAANPIYAGILTGITAAATGAQIATVASTKYTPLAKGGVVTGPTHALIGEGGQDELVLPLSKAKERGFGLGSNSINIVVNTGDVYTGDDLSRAVYDGVSKLQKTGALPPWKKVI